MTDQDAVSLKHYLERLFDERSREDRARWDGHRAEHHLLSEALTTALAEQQAWRASANEWRAALSDLTARFVTSNYLEQYTNGHVSKHDSLIQRIDSLERTHIAEMAVVADRQKIIVRTMWGIGILASVAGTLVSWLVTR